MKKTLISILLVTISTVLIAQTINFEKATGVIAKNKLMDRVYKFEPLGYFNGTINYLLLPNVVDVALGNIYRIEKYDLDMNLIKHERINLKEGQHKKTFNELIYFQDKLYLFTSFRNEKEQKIYLFVQTMDKTTFALNSDIRKIAEVAYNKKKRNSRIKTSYTISEDGTKLLIYAYGGVVKYIEIQSNKTGKQMETINQLLYVFDKDIKLLWKQEIGSAISSGIFVFDKYQIDNKANVYITGKSFVNEEEAQGLYIYKKHKFLSSDKYYTYIQPSNYQTSILYFANGGKTTKQLNLKLDNKFIKNISIKPKGDYIFCAGVYSLLKTVSAKGIFTCNLNIKTGKTEKVKTKEFDKKSFVTRLDTNDLEKFQKVTNINEWDPFSYSLSSLEFAENNDYIFIAERQLFGKLESRSGNMTSIYSTFTYKDLFVVRIKPSGIIEQINLIDKTQFGLGDDVHSYIYAIKDNKTYLIFNEMVPEKGMMKVAALKHTFLIELNKLGAQKREAITSFEDTDKNTIVMRPGAALYLKNKSTFVYPVQSLQLKYRAYEKVVIK